MTSEQLVLLTRHLHEAPLNPEKWRSFFDGLCNATTCEMGVFTTTSDRWKKALAGGGRGFSAEPLALYNAHYGKVDPYFQPCLERIERRVIFGEELVSRQEHLRSEFYNDLLRPYDLSYVTVVPCSIGRQRNDFVTLFRSSREGQVDASAAQILTLLIPQMDSALRTFHIIGNCGISATNLKGDIEEGSLQAFLLDKSGRLLAASETVERFLDFESPIKFRAGKFSFSIPKWQHLFIENLHQACHERVTRQMSVPLGTKLSTNGTEVMLRLRFFPVKSQDAVAPGESLCICLLSESGLRFEESVAVFTALNSFSPSEVRVTKLLLDGLNAAEIARAMNLSHSAARFHVKGALRKTGASRQAELLQKIREFHHKNQRKTNCSR